MGEGQTKLTGEAATGESLDFPALVDAYQHKLFNVILRMVGNHDDALDLVQEVFLKAYRSMGSFKGQSKVYTWLYRIAINAALSFRRSAAARMSRSSVSLEGNPAREEPDQKRDPADGRPVPAAAAQEKEAEDHIKEAITELEPELRAAVVLRDIEELSYEEIARILEVPRGTVKSRLHRGRLILREKLKDFL